MTCLPYKLIRNDVLSFKENDMTTLIVDGGWARDDNLSLGERPHENSSAIFYYEDISEILK